MEWICEAENDDDVYWTKGLDGKNSNCYDIYSCFIGIGLCYFPGMWLLIPVIWFFNSHSPLIFLIMHIPAVEMNNTRSTRLSILRLIDIGKNDIDVYSCVIETKCSGVKMFAKVDIHALVRPCSGKLCMFHKSLIEEFTHGNDSYFNFNKFI